MVPCSGHIMPPHFAPAGQRIGTTEYLAILEEVPIPWLEQHYNPGDVVLVQDSTPAHTTQQVQNLLRRKIPKFVPKEKWPPSSPDLNPSDYWLCSVMEEKANARSHGSVTGLKRAIRRAAAAIPPEEAQRACARLQGPNRACLSSCGDHIKYTDARNMYQYTFKMLKHCLFIRPSYALQKNACILSQFICPHPVYHSIQLGESNTLVPNNVCSSVTRKYIHKKCCGVRYNIFDDH